MKTLRIDLNYLAKTYGLEGRVMFRIIEDPETFRTRALEMTELPKEVADDLAAIMAIGTAPDEERPFNIAKELDQIDELMEAYEQ